MHAYGIRIPPPLNVDSPWSVASGSAALTALATCLRPAAALLRAHRLPRPHPSEKAERTPWPSGRSAVRGRVGSRHEGLRFAIPGGLCRRDTAYFRPFPLTAALLPRPSSLPPEAILVPRRWRFLK